MTTKKVSIIIPTIGTNDCIKAITSVLSQTYKNIEIQLFVDGYDNWKVQWAEDLLLNNKPNIKFNFINTPTGKNKFYGHRIYAACAHLIDSDYIAFLDEDNWYEPNHIQSLVDLIETDDSLHFVYSRRNIVNKDGKFICKDQCESLGWKTPIYGNWINGHLVDTSSYLFKRKTLIETGHVWHNNWGADRTYFKTVQDAGFKSDGTDLYTLNYRLCNSETSPKPEFFLEGNKVMKMKGLVK